MRTAEEESKATVFGYWVSDPERYGVAEFDRAGNCIYIEASVLKGMNTMADQIQVVYIIPASDGCFVATAHFSIESAEGFGRRFSCMLQTFSAI